MGHFLRTAKLFNEKLLIFHQSCSFGVADITERILNPLSFPLFHYSIDTIGYRSYLPLSPSLSRRISDFKDICKHEILFSFWDEKT